MLPNNYILSQEEVKNHLDRHMPNVLRKLSDYQLGSSKAPKTFRTRELKRPVDPSTFPFILEGQLASPEKIQDLGRLSEVPKIEQTVTIPDDGQEIRNVRFCRVPKEGFLTIINRAEFDTVLILFDGRERYGRIMVKGSGNKEGI